MCPYITEIFLRNMLTMNWSLSDFSCDASLLGNRQWLHGELLFSGNGMGWHSKLTYATQVKHKDNKHTLFANIGACIKTPLMSAHPFAIQGSKGPKGLCP